MLKLSAENLDLEHRIPVVSDQLTTFQPPMAAQMGAFTVQMANMAQQTARTSRTVSHMAATISKTPAQIHHTANILPMPVVQSAGSRLKTTQPPTLKLSHCCRHWEFQAEVTPRATRSGLIHVCGRERIYWFDDLQEARAACSYLCIHHIR